MTSKGITQKTWPDGHLVALHRQGLFTILSEAKHDKPMRNGLFVLPQQSSDN